MNPFAADRRRNGVGTPQSAASVPTPHPLPVLVIGYGNTLRGDDGLGPRVAQQLAGTFTSACDLASLVVIPCHQLTFDLAETVSQARCVVLIDAAVSDGPDNPPGTITCRKVQPDGDRPHSMLHHMAPEALLASAEALYGSVPPTVLWTVTGDQFDYGEQLSPIVEDVLPEFLARLAAYIQRALDTDYQQIIKRSRSTSTT